jgi:hypothetical protein
MVFLVLPSTDGALRGSHDDNGLEFESLKVIEAQDIKC